MSVSRSTTTTTTTGFWSAEKSASPTTKPPNHAPPPPPPPPPAARGQAMDDLEAQRAALAKIGWCAAILDDPGAEVQIPTCRRSPRPGEFTYLNKTFKTADTISAFVVVAERPAASASGQRLETLKALLTLGDGFNGHAGVCHGGLIATVLDEVMGLLCVENVRRRAVPGPAYMTAHLKTTFVQPVRANSTVLAVARLGGLEGRNLSVSATIEDGHGKVLARGEALFVRLKEKI